MTAVLTRTSTPDRYRERVTLAAPGPGTGPEHEIATAFAAGDHRALEQAYRRRVRPMWLLTVPSGRSSRSATWVWVRSSKNASRTMVRCGSPMRSSSSCSVSRLADRSASSGAPRAEASRPSRTSWGSADSSTPTCRRRWWSAMRRRVIPTSQPPSGRVGS